MADEKKYSPQEVALVILAKAAELLAKSNLAKSEQAAKVASHTSGLHTVEYHSTGNFNKSEALDWGFEPYQELQKAETGHERGINRQSDPSQRSRVMMGTSKAGSQMPLSRNPETRAEDKHDAVKEHKKVLGEMHSMPKPNLPKSEEMNKGTAQPAPSLAMSEKNPDEKQDARLGEEVEGLCERHMLENKSAERKEGHKIVKSEMCKMCKSGMQKSEFADLHKMLETMEKAEKSKHDRCVEHVEQNSPEVSNPHAVCVAEGVKPAAWKKGEFEEGVNEVGTKIQKAEAGQGAGNKERPSNPMKPRIEEEQAPQRDAADFEPKPGHAEAPDHREADQADPGANPAEKAEGNNPRAGAVPANKGVDKLRHFHSFMHGKRSMKKGIALS